MSENSNRIQIENDLTTKNEPTTTVIIDTKTTEVTTTAAAAPLECDKDLQSELLELANRVSISTKQDEQQMSLSTLNDLANSELGDANDLIFGDPDDPDDDGEYKLPEVDWVNLEAKLKEAQDEIIKQVKQNTYFFFSNYH
jgi:hypothetical protein